MKGLKKYIILIIMLFAFFPTITKAATRLTASTQNPVVGTTLYVQIDIDYGKEALIEELHYQISYNGNFFKLEDVIFTQSNGTWSTTNVTNDYGLNLEAVNIDKTTSTNAWEYGGPVQLKFTVLNTGTCDNGACVIGIKTNGNAYYLGGNIIEQSLSGVTVIPVAASDNTTLKSLYIKGTTISPTFNNKTFNYTSHVDTDVTEIEVFAEASDKKQVITGTGKRALEYGDNKVEVKIIAENGAEATYTIMVNRKDNRTGDVNLKKLSVSNTNIKYDEKTDTYFATVSKSIDKVLINATANDPNAMLTGTGTKNLTIGNNTFELNVTSTGGSSKTYTINILRVDYEIQQDIESNELLSLSINGLVFDMTTKQKTYLYGVSKEAQALEINAVPISKTAKVEITGNEKLKTGFNVISIKVTETNETTSEYKIIAYKSPTSATQIQDLNNLNIPDPNLVINVSENANHKLNKEQINIIKNYDKKIYYNVVNIYNGIKYQIKIDKNINVEELDLNIKQTNSAPLTYNSNLPSGLEVTMYIGDNFADKTSLRIYTFDGSGNYKLLTEGVAVTNGYITFNTSDTTNYIFTTGTLGVEPKKDNSLYIIIGVTVVVIILVIILPKLKKKDKKNDVNENEPLY